MELGTFPDWIIAASNICMAGAAMYAAINAKNWLTQKKHEQAMPYAITLIHDDLNNILRRLNTYSKELPKDIAVISSYKIRLKNKFKVYILFREAITSLAKIESLGFTLNGYENLKVSLIDYRSKIYKNLNKIDEYANANAKNNTAYMNSIILELKRDMIICRREIRSITSKNNKIELNRI
ncbi:MULTISPECIES: hypothetical protein [Pectobacterium]|uniref:hypothetical protein n=1 Tax=Pectobacterium TaxID=122277 RepID=UPI001BB2D672|nr:MULTISPECIES: hypothetical protein [Pectobacterium]MCA6960228.1 hypothetical protein [Pectobacterium odoriferum]MCH5008347.1 hypothetical protein [Pectobacterium odoriferum]MCL6333805.1 hypothetical protein [Pectobacterium carotovorum subsp. carotovorum]MCL6346825.1 hypothetical protein [Pectobacterium carotovorum subsp. carotovorum]MCL6401264.1 hypothetical protein [Pectobacterium carotovorum subsp. carotovorum]